ncbi:MAG: hypothetical protein M1818_003891 [Claussenomyces sp. TS43310]|nr:MAG: hypothetical protein M1818_003891 [Claussenomyces sp. TS43310]
MSHSHDQPPINTNAHESLQDPALFTPESSSTSSSSTRSSLRRAPRGARSPKDPELGEMEDRRPPLHRPTDGRSHQPLLHKQDEERGRTGFNDVSGRPPTFSRRSTMRSRSPDTQAKLATKKKYTYAAFFLALSLVSFTVQTETARYIQQDLHWDKAYCMLYLTHGSWSLLWPFQLLVLRIQKWNMPWKTFWRRHAYLVRTTAQMVETQELDIPRGQRSPIPYFIKMTAFITCALTVAGGSWYVAVNMTSSADLTAIYNCSAFFAYAFSVPLLKEKLRFGKSFAVIVAIVGVLIVAYGDSKPEGKTDPDGEPGDPSGGEDEAKNRLLGNLIIGVGSVLYGFYEVLYKKLACPPEGVSPGRGMIFANTFGSMIGCFTLAVLWIPLPILHFTGLERFELPRGEAAWMMLISVLGNVTFSGSFLVLISLTSPVLSSVAALLTIFIVAIVDWLLTGKPLKGAAMVGGVLIISAFGLLSWSTFREMQEEQKKLDIDLVDDDDESENDD